jgi:hypothetical protein
MVLRLVAGLKDLSAASHRVVRRRVTGRAARANDHDDAFAEISLRMARRTDVARCAEVEKRLPLSVSFGVFVIILIKLLIIAVRAKVFVELEFFRVNFVQNNAKELLLYRVLVRQSRADSATRSRPPLDD